MEVSMMQVAQSNGMAIGGLKQEVKLDLDSCLSVLTLEENVAITHDIPIRTYPKGSFLLREGQIANNCYYIFKGCIREFYLKSGEEKTSEFFSEGDSLSCDNSKLDRVPAKQYWQCLEDTTVSVFSHEKEREVYRRFPRLESLCRLEMEKKYGQLRDTMNFYFFASPEERYLDILSNRPDLLQRVPQYQLASFIGIKPESLSRIRRRLRA